MLRGFVCGLLKGGLQATNRGQCHLRKTKRPEGRPTDDRRVTSNAVGRVYFPLMRRYAPLLSWQIYPTSANCSSNAVWARIASSPGLGVARK